MGSAVPTTVESIAATKSDSISPAMTRSRSHVQSRRVVAVEQASGRDSYSDLSRNALCRLTSASATVLPRIAASVKT